MDTVMKKYVEKDGQTLKVELYYSLGGVNYFSSKQERRGYYLSVSPVERSVTGGVTFETYKAYSGVKELLLEVKRKSKKSEQQAEDLVTDKKIESLINYVIEKKTA